MLKTTIWDIIRVAEPPYLPPDLSEKYSCKLIEEIEKEIDENDLILLRFFFIDDIWLMAKEKFDIACAHMIIVLEDRLRKEAITKNITYKNRRNKNKNPENMSLNELKEALSKFYSEKFNENLQEINKIRPVFIHTNTGKIFDLPFTTKTNHKLIEHEKIRTHIRFTPKYCKELLFFCLKVLKELDSKWLEEVKVNFDELIQQELERKKSITFL